MEVGTVTKLASLLPEEQRKSIAIGLAQDLTEGQTLSSIEVLSELVNVVSLETKKEISPLVYELFADIVGNNIQSELSPAVYKLCGQFEDVSVDVLSLISAKLRAYALKNRMNFEERMRLLNSSDFMNVATIDSSEVLDLFGFLNVLFKENDNLARLRLDEINALCYAYVTCDEEKISTAAANIMRWRLSSFNEDGAFLKMWECISTLMTAHDSFKRTNGLILWLCYLKEFAKSDAKLQSIYSTGEYWQFLKQSLLDDSHDHKKMSLSIIQLTVTSISKDIDTDIMTWKMDRASVYIESWKRFCTLYEIVGIDSSLHQAEDAAPDLVGSLSLDSHIPTAFALTLLSIGFKSSQESIRRVAMNLVFSIPQNNLMLLTSDVSFLRDTFLPFVLHAFHYSVKKDATGLFCPFLTKLVDFICNCLSNQQDQEGVSVVCEAILQVLVKNRLAFDVARIALALGLLKGLNASKFNILDDDHVGMIVQMFESESENEIYEKTLQTVFLRILLFANSAANEKYESLGRFLQMNQQLGITILKENIHLVKASPNINKIDHGSLRTLSTYALVAYVIVEERASGAAELSNVSKNDLITVCSMIDSTPVRSPNCAVLNGLDIFFDCIQNEEVRHLYGSHIPTTHGSLSDTYDQISDVLINSEDEDDLILATYRLELLSKNQKFQQKSLETYLLLAEKSYASLKTSHSTSKTFYKVKDIFYSSIFRFCLNVNIEERQLKTAISIAEVDFTLYDSEGRLLLVNFIQLLLELPFTGSHVKPLVIVLENLWDELVEDRLILKQNKIHCSLIRALFHKSVLSAALDDLSIGEVLTRVGSEILTQSHSRRSLLPTLFSAIDAYDDLAALQNMEFLIPVIVRGISTKQVTTNLFTLEPIIAQIYDQEVDSTTAAEGLYAKVYGVEEVSFRVAMASILAKLQKPDFIVTFFDFVENHESELNLFHPKNRSDGLEEWKRIQLLSMMIILMTSLPPNEVQNLTQKFGLAMLFKEQSPLCRVYLEWMIALCLLKNPSSRISILEQFSIDISQQSSIQITTFERICVLLGQKLEGEEAASFMRDFVVKYLVPSATSNKAWHRHFAVSLVCSVYPEIIKRKLPLSSDVLVTLENVYRIAAASEGFGTHRNGDAHLWDIVKDLTLVGVFGGILLKVSDRTDIDSIPAVSFAKYLKHEDVRIPIGADFESFKAGAAIDAHSDYLKDLKKSSSPLQKKSGTWSTPVDVDQVIGNGNATSSIQRSDLIVVSSLVDKPPNLGGICRLCDVLGAGLLTLGDIRVKDHRDFKNVAVTADRWMPMVEVKPESIADYMISKKKEGYTLVGLEQTDKSVVLDEKLKFPKKSLILLGREREGIPGDLLAILDMCIEIKQVGVIRSMNIQTATAVIVHAYSAQHC
ncbi:unnamed protein product [Kuraishia capsulata CBS 1993]|uniref:tRNA/rRNA methyltransferase SpoU type domain-containing protein n=1 Tax=Kuraishia capsulata CBS 1993 TaxID=1382522 RepID=W6MV37_9ASCO|nr:uncharacterized protein KUCA_T00002021001 [Kuraishia capsulata CBS 1993]CDK26050.1 unnamed protein product [Kuraishia capsulata CBS 1993]